MANFELSLNGSWEFKGFAECNGEELRAYKLEYEMTVGFQRRLLGPFT